MNITFEGDYADREQKKLSRLAEKDELLKNFLIKWDLKGRGIDDYSQFETELFKKIKEIYL